MFDLSSLTICLVEPSRAQGNIIQHFLHELGVEMIDRAETGADALQRIREVPRPDIVISAMYLPDMTGSDLVTQMRLAEDMREMPFVLISSETRPQQLNAIRQAGAMAILPKPFTVSQLDKAITSSVDYLNIEETRAELESLDLDTKRVLLVDDSLTSRNYLRNVLERFGFCDIDEASNGKEATEVLQFDTNYHLIITDYNMPEMDGKALTEYIRNDPRAGSIPVLMVSSEQDQQRLAAVEEAGVSAICDKPFDMSTLSQLIRQFL